MVCWSYSDKSEKPKTQEAFKKRKNKVCVDFPWLFQSKISERGSVIILTIALNIFLQ